MHKIQFNPKNVINIVNGKFSHMSTSNINVKEHEVATEIVSMLKRLQINPRLVANLETIEEEEETLDFDQLNTIYVDESEYEDKSDEDVNMDTSSSSEYVPQKHSTKKVNIPREKLERVLKYYRGDPDNNIKSHSIDETIRNFTWINNNAFFNNHILKYEFIFLQILATFQI